MTDYIATITEIAEVVEINGVESIQTVAIESVEVGIQGPPGPRGPAGAAGATSAMTFAFGDVSPMTFVAVPANKLVLEVHLIIETPFDALDAAISFGDNSNPQSLMSTMQNNPREAGYYQTTPLVSYPVETELKLFFTPGTDPQAGAGRFFILIEG